jgi:hypothetical protein
VKPLRQNGLRQNGDKAAKTERTENAFLRERNRIRAANDEKTARLRALRLAKEARDREVAVAAAAVAEAERATAVPKSPRRKRKPSPDADQP